MEMACRASATTSSSMRRLSAARARMAGTRRIACKPRAMMDRNGKVPASSNADAGEKEQIPASCQLAGAMLLAAAILSPAATAGTYEELQSAIQARQADVGSDQLFQRYKQVKSVSSSGRSSVRERVLSSLKSASAIDAKPAPSVLAPPAAAVQAAAVASTAGVAAAAAGSSAGLSLPAAVVALATAAGGAIFAGNRKESPSKPRAVKAASTSRGTTRGAPAPKATKAAGLAFGASKPASKAPAPKPAGTGFFGTLATKAGTTKKATPPAKKPVAPAPKRKPAPPALAPVFSSSARTSRTSRGPGPEGEEGSTGGLVALLALALAVGLNSTMSVRPSQVVSSSQASGPGEIDLKALAQASDATKKATKVMPAFIAPPSRAPPAAAPAVASLTTTPEKAKTSTAPIRASGLSSIKPEQPAQPKASLASKLGAKDSTTTTTRPFSLFPAAKTPTPTTAEPLSIDALLSSVTQQLDDHSAKVTASATTVHGPSASGILLLAASGLGLAAAAFLFSGTTMDEASGAFGRTVNKALDKKTKNKALDAMLMDQYSLSTSLLEGTPADPSKEAGKKAEEGEGGVDQNGPGW